MSCSTPLHAYISGHQEWHSGLAGGRARAKLQPLKRLSWTVRQGRAVVGPVAGRRDDAHQRVSTSPNPKASLRPIFMCSSSTALVSCSLGSSLLPALGQLRPGPMPSPSGLQENRLRPRSPPGVLGHHGDPLAMRGASHAVRARLLDVAAGAGRSRPAAPRARERAPPNSLARRRACAGRRARAHASAAAWSRDPRSVATAGAPCGGRKWLTPPPPPRCRTGAHGHARPRIVVTWTWLPRRRPPREPGKRASRAGAAESGQSRSDASSPRTGPRRNVTARPPAPQPGDAADVQ